uniref:Uncharacterized protein n=1 Tax=Callithrix jacchus TaxID=9483 RepID=A0A8I4A5G8_CALJA
MIKNLQKRPHFQGLGSRGKNTATRRHTTISLNWKLRVPPGHFGLLLPLSQQAKKGVTVLARVLTQPIKMKSIYYSTTEVRKSIHGTQGIDWALLVLPCPVIKVNGKLQQPNPDRTTTDPDPSGMKVWVIPPGKKSTTC